MKIVILSTYDINGGAGIAAYRLHKAFLTNGVESLMVVQSKKTDDITVITPKSILQKILNKIRPTLDRIPLFFYKKKTKNIFSLSWVGNSGISDLVNSLKPDIVHIHWICHGILSLREIGKIEAPIVCSLHDMWFFTGGCHYSGSCKSYQINCGKCWVLGSSNALDLSKLGLARKNKLLQKKKIAFIGLSQWISKEAKNSKLLQKSQIENLPNPINTDIFKEINKTYSRQIWNLPPNKKLILFGAMNAISDLRKGYKELITALEQLNYMEAEFIVYGSSEPIDIPKLNNPIRYIGQIHDETSLVMLYNAVDVMVVPSLQENLSNTIMESLSCAVPVVAFNIGGNSDMIDHKVNGYLAVPFKANDLKDGIEWVLKHSDPGMLRQNARQKVLNEFDDKKVIKKYLNLYSNILNLNKLDLPKLDK